MTKHYSVKKALLSSVLSLALCIAMLAGTTFAWFTDTASSEGNIITAGTLDVEMYWADGAEAVPIADEDWADASEGAIFEYALWEPGFVQVRHIKIANEGSLDLKYKVNIVVNGEVSELADVIDVYYVDPAQPVVTRDDLAGIEPLGTLSQVLDALGTTGNGVLKARTADTVTLALVMQKEAGNEYQGKAIGMEFAVQVLATQVAGEEDSFDDQYDNAADYPIVSIPVARPEAGSGESLVLKAAEDNAIAIELPAALVDALPAGVTSIGIAHTVPKIDATDFSITYDSVEIVDQNGNVIDLEELGNVAEASIVLPAQTTFAPGTQVIVYHDGEAMATTTVAEDGTIPYAVTHLCEVSVTVPKITTIEDFKAAVKNGTDTIYLDGRFEIDEWGNAVGGTTINNAVTIRGGTIVRATGNYEGLKIYTNAPVVFEGVTFETVKGNAVVAFRKADTNVTFKDCKFVNLAAPSTGNTGVFVNANQTNLYFENCTFENMPVQVTSDCTTDIKLFFKGCELSWKGPNCPGMINLYNSSVSDIDFVDCKLSFDAENATKAYGIVSTKTNVGVGTTIDFDNVEIAGVGADGKIWKVVGKGGVSTGKNVVVTAQDNVTYTYNGVAVDLSTYLFN